MYSQFGVGPLLFLLVQKMNNRGTSEALHHGWANFFDERPLFWLVTPERPRPEYASA